MVTKAKAPAREAIESLAPIVVELRGLERVLWRIERQAECIPSEADEAPDRLLSGVYHKHSAGLKALGIVTEDPDSDDIRLLLDGIKVVAKSFGAAVGDTRPLPRQRPIIWTNDSRNYDVDGHKALLREGLQLTDDGALKEERE